MGGVNGKRRCCQAVKETGEAEDKDQPISITDDSAAITPAITTAARKQAVESFLVKVPLFKRLPKDQIEILAANVVAQVFEVGQKVITQGEDGDKFYVIDAGEAEVAVETDGKLQTVATLKAGDYFGEIALLRDEPRTATISAKTRLNTLTIARPKFRELGLNEKLQFPKRRAVGAGQGQVNKDIKNPTPSTKTAEERAFIADALHANEPLSTLGVLTDDRVNQLVDCAWKTDVQADFDIIKQGDLQADYFYIVIQGSFEVLVCDEETPLNQPPQMESILTVERGGSFGELALLYLEPRAATVRAKTNAVCWVIDRMNFKRIIMAVSEDRLEEYIRYLDMVDVLLPLIKEEKRAIAKALVELHFDRGEVIMQQGERGNVFYILFDGEVDVMKDGARQAILKVDPRTNKCLYFGEQALLRDEPRGATVRVVSEVARTLVLDRDCFQALLGPLEEIIKQSAAEARKRSSTVQDPDVDTLAAKAVESRKEESGSIRFSDLKKIGLLGCGGFGAVWLYEHRKTEETYALKAISKGFIVQAGMQQSVKSEKNILLMCDSSFVVKLFETFNDEEFLYLLLEPAMGGELYATYSRKGLHGSEKHGRFYTSGVVYAFEHLHAKHIIYRDLKPENLLLTDKGNLKLTDMGLAKYCIGKSYTTCGTPDYFAPEMIESIGHTIAVDWWALGILVFELMAGSAPFEADTPMKTYAKIMKGISSIRFPKKCQGAVSDFVKALLRRSPSDRLPVKSGGTENIRKHAWFSGFDWDAMKEHTMEPPYKPTVKSKDDIRNFCSSEDDMPPVMKFEDDGSGWDRNFATSF